MILTQKCGGRNSSFRFVNMHHLPGLGGWCIFIRVMFYLKYMIMYLFVFFY